MWAAMLAVVGGLTLVVAASAATTYLDLTTTGATGTVNGAIISQGVGPAGTGQFDPFLTMQTSPTETGYNSDAASADSDATDYPAGRTHPLPAAAVPPVTVGGVKYREFALDSNDPGSDSYMSVDQIKIFLDDQSNLKGYTDATETFANDTGTAPSKIYDLGENVVLMRSQGLSSGSGVQDITVFIPDSSFPASCAYGSTSCNKFVVFYTKMGATGSLNIGNGCSPTACNYDTEAGFEEWRTRKLPVVNVTKTAVPSRTQTFPWTVKKYVSVDGGANYFDASANLNLFNGDSANVKWKIDYTKGTPVDSGQKVTGSVTVRNPTGSAPFGFSLSATVNSLSDVLSQTGQSDSAVTLTCPGTTFPKTLGAGDSFTCTYTKDLPSSATGTNTATAVVDTGDTPDVSYSGSAPFDPSTATPTTVDGSASLDDDLDSGLPKTVSGSGSEIYDTNQACPASRTVPNTAVLTTSDTHTVLTDPASVVITCYGLTTTKDAHPAFGRTFDWSVKKEVSLDGVTYVDGNVNVDQFLGDSSTLYWRITPTRGAAQDSGFGVTGTITIANASPLDASNVAVSDSIAGVGAATVDCDPGAGVSTSVNITHGTSATCTYSSTLPNGDTRLNTATATLFGQTYTGTASIDFAGVTPTTTDATATLTGDTLSSGLFPAPATSGTPVDYTTSAPCPGGPIIKNTVTLTEAGGTTRTDDAQATITCRSLTVTKTATPSFTRTWTWTVNKGSGDKELTLELGQTFLEPYSVTYQATKADTAFNVSGTITVTSPAGAPSRAVNVTDVYAGTNASVDCNGLTAGTGLPTNIAGGETLNCTYVVDLGNTLTNGNNVATATITNVPSGHHDFTSNSVAVSFVNPTTEIDETVNVSDTVPAGSFCTGLNTPATGCTVANAGTGPPSGSITASLPSPFTKTFTYTRIIGPYGSGQCGDQTVNNTASFTATDTPQTGNSSVAIVVHVPCPTGCTLTQGYWKTHSIRGPAPFDDNWNNIPTAPYAPGPTPGTAENTVFFYSGQTWYEVFWTAPKGGNAYYILAHQYEAAVLNILNGADPSAVTATLNAALALFSNPANTPTSIGALKSNSALRAQFISLAGILGSYNEGTIGPGHCSEDATTSSAP